MSTPTTRRYPRTLNEAYGPYATELAPLRERYDPMPAEDKLVVVGSVIGFAAFGLMILMGWIQ